MIGQTLAHYKILEKIGSGGMGDVYLAEDTKLDRKVALKVLPPELAESEERRARFKREAKAIAALDHPNIVQVFSVEEAEGVHFITMQLVHGKTVTELLPKNGFALNEFFEIAIPLADAVAAAHQEGITHRDLKPDNMMVGDDGRVKVLDFGLAKPIGGFTATDAESEVATAAKTAEGVIIGTVRYMSPEQAQGKAVDARSATDERTDLRNGEAEVQHLHAAVVRHHHVAGFEVPMDDPLLVCGRNSIGKRYRNVEELVECEAFLRKKLRQGLSLHQLHRDEVDAVGLLDGVDSNNVRVVESCKGLGFALEARAALFAFG